MINTKEIWREMQKQRIRSLKVTFDSEFQEKFAKDFSEMAKYDNYEYGRKATEALSKVLDKDFRVLEIGPGPGTLTVPLAEKVKKIVAVESSKTAVDYLRKNLKESQIENVEIINKKWPEIDNQGIEGRFDLVICSHFLWQVKDIEKHLKGMENASNKYCAIIQPAGRDIILKEIWTKITGEDYRGEFDPDADYFVYLILRQKEQLLNVSPIEYAPARTLDQEVRYIASFIGKYVEVNTHIKEVVEKYVSDRMRDIGQDKIAEKRSAVVMWWQLKKVA